MILLTGFEAFQGDSFNPSQWLVEKWLERNKNSSVSTSSASEKIAALVLPVSYEEAPKVFREKFLSLKPKKVLMLGLASAREALTLERVALNWQESSIKDERHWSPPIGKIAENLEAAYFCPLDLSQLQKELDERGFPTMISHSAGAFVCNRLYFEFFALTQGKGEGFFLHLPRPKEMEFKSVTQSGDWDQNPTSFQMQNLDSNPNPIPLSNSQPPPRRFSLEDQYQALEIALKFLAESSL